MESWSHLRLDRSLKSTFALEPGPLNALVRIEHLCYAVLVFYSVRLSPIPSADSLERRTVNGRTGLGLAQPKRWECSSELLN